ncbi:MAG: pyridoxamine 5'-phosphate oxidase family protein [Desulfobacterales bacterium]|nr:pyridoxamine 5'-phosphate oxidase family protein [Desulfobacterales bacterium]
MTKDFPGRIRSLVNSRNVCVLATLDNDRPYCSLMNYVTDESCRDFYMVTLRNSNKYRNLLANPRVSLLVDSRENAPLSSSQALTVEGIFEPVAEDGKRNWALTRLIDRNPLLKDFISLPDVDVICIRAQSFLLLDGISDARYVKLT